MPGTFITAPALVAGATYGVCKLFGTSLWYPSLGYTGLVAAGAGASLYVVHNDSKSDPSVGLTRVLMTLIVVGVSSYFMFGYWATLWGIHRFFYFVPPVNVTLMNAEWILVKDFWFFMKNIRL